MKVLVLLGGNSNEREVSLRSGAAVRDALTDGAHEVMVYDPRQGYEGLKAFVGKVDCVFPILHGKGGEDGTIQAELEKLGFKYLGTNSKVSKICFDKELFKKELKKLQILTPKGEVVTRNSIQYSPLIHKPYVLKPIDGGSTIDAFIVRNPETQSYNQEIFNHYETMLLEELIEGTEITIPVLDNKALPVIEIIPPPGGEFDYENKYNGATQELCPPKHVSAEKQHEAQFLAEQIHLNVGVRHLSRTDIIIDREGRLWVLELNTMPGMTAQSLFPKAAVAAGIGMPQLIQKFLDMVMTKTDTNSQEQAAK
jgi:D-alanine-D-alanine ligase